MQLTRIFVVLAALAVIALPATALAQPAIDGYSSQGPQVQEEIEQTNPPGGGDSEDPAPTATAATPAAGDEGGRLPFTGFDAALVLATGLVLVGMGLGLRRLVRPTEIA